jgi:hypothetical protein
MKSSIVTCNVDINSKIVRLPQTYTIQKIRLVSFYINQAVAETNGHIVLRISNLPHHSTTFITPAGLKVPCDNVLLAPIDGKQSWDSPSSRWDFEAVEEFRTNFLGINLLKLSKNYLEDYTALNDVIILTFEFIHS